MAIGPITSWQIDGETVADFIFLGSKITADGDCSHKIKRCLLLRRRAMTNLDRILKSRVKSWLKTQHSKTKIITSGPITSWKIDGETMKTVTDFIFLDSKITVGHDCSHETCSIGKL